MRKIILLGFLLLALRSFANVPGYQGLRFSAIYEPGIMFSPIVGQFGGAKPMIYHNLALDYVVSRGISVGLKYDFMTYKVPPNGSVYDDYYNNDPAVRDYRSRYMQNTVSLVCKFFMRKKGFIAPVGRYITLGVFYQNATFKGDERFVGNESTSRVFTGVVNTGGLVFGMGRNFIVFNRCLIDLGFNLNLPVPLAKDNELKRVSWNNAIFRNFFEIHVGFGAFVF